MKKYVALFLMILFVLPLTACGKNDKHVIEITVPAGSQEAFVYSEEEIRAIDDQITIYSGAGLGETEVILKPIDETVETGYVAEYLTHGMPVKLDAVKGEWFKVGVAVQNDSERGPIAVSVEAEGVEIRSAESVETEEKNASGEDLLLLTDTFWNNVTKVVYYDFNEDIYELSNAGKLEKLQAIFKGMEYKEIENPWIEGWYMFEIHTDEKTYDMGITGNTISFDGKFYEATDSIAKEVTKMMKSETVSKEWTEEEILELFKTKANMDYTFVTCASVFDFAYERVGVILYTDSKDGYIYVAFMDEEGNMQHCGVEATLVDLPEFIYWGNGEVTFKVCSKDGKYYTQKLSFSIDENKVNFVSEAIEDISEESISELKEKYNLMEPEEEKVSSKVDVGVSVGIDN